MKRISLAILALSLAAIPAVAQKGRSNRGGAQRGDERTAQVHSLNESQEKDKSIDKDRDRSRDNDTNQGKHNGETKGKHKAKGHRH